MVKFWQPQLPFFFTVKITFLLFYSVWNYILIRLLLLHRSHINIIVNSLIDSIVSLKSKDFFTCKVLGMYKSSDGETMCIKALLNPKCLNDNGLINLPSLYR